MTDGRGRNAWTVLNAAQRKERKRLAALGPETPVVSAADAQCGFRGWVGKSPSRYACRRCGLYHEKSEVLTSDKIVKHLMEALVEEITPVITSLAGMFSASKSFEMGAPYTPRDAVALLHMGEAIVPTKVVYLGDS